MKYVAIIASLIVISLNAVAIVEAVERSNGDSCRVSCCDTDQDERPSENNEAPCGPSCNPFKVCSACTGFVPVLQAVYNIPSINIALFRDTSIHSKPLQVANTIWHPPQIG